MIYNPTTKSLWKELRECFSKIDGTRIFHLSREVYQVKQGTLYIANYFEKHKILLDELATADEDDCLCILS